MTARRIEALTFGLPHRSRTMRALASDLWPAEETLLGLVVERLDALAAITVKAHGGKAKTPDPIVPRPKKATLRKAAAANAMETTDMLAGLDRAIGGEG